MWRRSKKTFNDYNLVEHTINMNEGFDIPCEYETALVGHYGEIWEYSSTHFSVLVVNARIGRKIAEMLGRSVHLKLDDEVVLRFPLSRLKEVSECLKIPKYHKTSVKIANAYRT